jgi:hypothetical protein
MKKFNNTLAGTDCGDAGLPAHSRDISKAKPALHAVPRKRDLRVVERTPDIEPMAARAMAPNACDWTKSDKPIA